VKGAPFKTAPGAFQKRSSHNLSYNKHFTADFGQLIPIYTEYCMPGDTFKINLDLVIRSMPLISPVMHKTFATTHWFFCPFRILDDNWETFITGGPNGDDESTQPVIPPDTPWENTSLLNYLYDFTPPLKTTLNFNLNAWKLMVYNQTYNDYYRDENLIEEYDLMDMNWKYRAFTKDYFTSSLPFQQRGTSPAMHAVFSDAAIDFSNMLGFGDQTVGIRNYSGSPYPDTTPLIYGRQFPNQYHPDSLTVGVINQYDDLGKAKILPQYNITQNDKQEYRYLQTLWDEWTIHNLNNAKITGDIISEWNINDLREAFQIQRYLEALARSGVKYTEVLKAIWGVSPTDERLDRPEYIGGSHQPIIISEVLQTSASEDGTNGSKQGNMAGHGITANSTHIGNYKCYEWGMIIGILSIMPTPAYCQGVDRRDTTESRFDYPNPFFMHLSERPTLNRELCITGTPYDNMPFGFQGIWDEWRIKHDSCNGLMLDDGFSSWHLTRFFDVNNPPALNREFIECSGDTLQGFKRIFAVPTQPGFVVNANTNCEAIRPMPFIADPGLVDH